MTPPNHAEEAAQTRLVQMKLLLFAAVFIKCLMAFSGFQLQGVLLMIGVFGLLGDAVVFFLTRKLRMEGFWKGVQISSAVLTAGFLLFGIAFWRHFLDLMYQLGFGLGLVAAMMGSCAVVLGGAIVVLTAAARVGSEAWNAANGVQLRAALVEKGYTWMTLDQAARLYDGLGGDAYKIPPHDDFGVLPGYVDGDAQSIVNLMRQIRGRNSP